MALVASLAFGGVLRAPPRPLITCEVITASRRGMHGNYCALGALVEFVTGEPLDSPIQQLDFDPLGLDGLHLSTAAHFIPTFPTFDDVDTPRPPCVFSDQYGWGPTVTVSGAVSCIWV
jgi:CubicO group peptidase (beta-lactamase class C family)|tara:strand:- start:2103 stop:2456 length:354 start_codon:yes stop_codon:yes gene_type:complete